MRPVAHLARLDTWLAAQAIGITIRGLRLDTGYARGLLADLEAEHATADTQISAALGCPGASPKFADWLDGQATAAGITGLPRTPTGRLQVTADTLATLLAEHADTLPAQAAELARARLAMSKASNLIASALVSACWPTCGTSSTVPAPSPLKNILTRLRAPDVAPWADLKGQPLDARGLARLLDDYDITSKKVKVDSRSAWGYRAEHHRPPRGHKSSPARTTRSRPAREGSAAGRTLRPVRLSRLCRSNSDERRPVSGDIRTDRHASCLRTRYGHQRR